MCGITGFLNLAGQQPADAGILLGMANRLAHRGPDDSGLWVEGGIALAQRRLSILDLSPAGHQPMHSACGRYVLVYNGEIYNYQDIRRQIETEPYFRESIGHWRGHSDTEVMLAAIACWGLMPALERMVGMFAIALWDRKARALFLVRDRMGEKPLYYARCGATLLFGSELKALRAHPAFAGRVDRGALSLLMRYNYIPAPYTIYEGVHKLPAAHCLTITEGGEMNLLPYWSLAQSVRHAKANPFTGGDTEAIDALEAQLRLAVRGQMESDVPLGAFLSGGVDSSTVVALMQAQSDRPVKTFSIGFFEDGFDEAQHARRVAQHLGTEHTELYVTARQAQDVIPLLPQLYDEPFSDSSQIPTFLVSQLARRHVTVSLSGDGGDELFGGYNRYRVAGDVWRRMSRLPSGVRTLMAAGIHAVPPALWDKAARLAAPLLPRRLAQGNMGDKLHKFAGIMGASGQDLIYHQLLSHWQEPAALVIGGHEPETAFSDSTLSALLPDFVERMMYLDSISYLPDDILVKVDRAAMGVSLETRVPMLDHRVVEFAWSLPLHMKMRAGESKWLLKQVLYRHVPREMVDRPKMGFGVPIDQWLRGALRDWAEELLNPARMKAEGFFDPALVQEKWQQHLSGQQNWQYLLWDVLMVQAWLRHEGETS
jgi:asparagine synthase (glutamine-hydrolysing)